MAKTTTKRAPVIVPAPKAVTAPGKSGETVTVGNKLPYTFCLRLQRLETRRVPLMGAGLVEEQYAVPYGDEVIIRGNAHPSGKTPKFMIIGGYARTQGISKEFFDLWLEQNAGLDMVRNGLIFSAPTADHFEGIAEERAEIKTGLEPIDPADPWARLRAAPRIRRPTYD